VEAIAKYLHLDFFGNISAQGDLHAIDLDYHRPTKGLVGNLAHMPALSDAHGFQSFSPINVAINGFDFQRLIAGCLAQLNKPHFYSVCSILIGLSVLWPLLLHFPLAGEL
jgi:hypothetical protein